MSILALCNVGLRDVMLDGQKIEPARMRGQALREQYGSEIASRLSFPILEPSLHYIIDQEEKGIDRLLLYGTDQPDASRHYQNDTLYVAAIAAQRIPDLFTTGLKSVETALVQGINPALYDEALEAFERLLVAVAETPVERCYIILCGGIPACNTALLFHGVRQFGDQLRVIYTPDGGTPQELRTSTQVAASFQEAVAIERLQRHDFGNALQMLDALHVPMGLLSLTTYAEQRLNFDFVTAQKSLQTAMKEGDYNLRRFIGDQQEMLSLDHLIKSTSVPAVQPERILALLRELYWNAAITHDQRRYADFLGRVYRFQEAVLRYLVEVLYALPTDLTPKVRIWTKKTWTEGIQKNHELTHFLSGQIYADRPLDWQDIGRPTYKALLNYAIMQGGMDADGKPLIEYKAKKTPNYQAILERVNGLDLLVDLRHRTIIGHDFEGVSEEIILNNMKKIGNEKTPVDRMATILAMLGVRVQPSPYELVAGYAVAQLRQGMRR